MTSHRLMARSIIAFLICLAVPRTGIAGFVLHGNVGASNRLDLGLYAGGTRLDIAISGTVNLLPQTGFNWITNPDGSLFQFNDPATYQYALAGSTLYPTVAGGDGINHFAGGGANYDTATGTPYGHFGFAGKQTTDTTDPAAIRFGAVVYTFSLNPTRDDWHFLGFGGRILVPTGGAHLFLAVNDSNNDVFPGVNSGSYSVQVTPVAEPATITLCFSGLLAIASWNPIKRQKRQMAPR